MRYLLMLFAIVSFLSMPMVSNADSGKRIDVSITIPMEVFGKVVAAAERIRIETSFCNDLTSDECFAKCLFAAYAEEIEKKYEQVRSKP